LDLATPAKTGDRQHVVEVLKGERSLECGCKDEIKGKAMATRRWVAIAQQGLQLLVLLFAAIRFAAPAAAAEPRRYELDVNVDPGNRHVSVSGHLSLQIDKGESTVSFNLYEAFTLGKFAVDGVPVHCFREAATSREIELELPQQAGEGLVDLSFSYSGQLQELPGWGTPGVEGPFMDDSAGPDRVELALYSSWYPSFGFGPTFDVEMDLTLPRGWNSVCIGQEQGHSETKEIVRSQWVARGVNDVVIVASPKLRTKEVETAAGRVRISHTRLPESYLRREVEETEQTLLLFSKILGTTSGGEILQRVYSPRDWGQGFARPGLIVMSEGYLLRELEEDPETSSVYGNAHETAHFWWRYGFGQGDWINEAFAEYFALLAIQAIQGESALQRGLDERCESVRALPADAVPLAKAPVFNDANSYTIKYNKGALMLDAFRKRLGDDCFFNACRSFYESIKGRRASTEDFRLHWIAALKDDKLLAAWLDSSGQSPVPPAGESLLGRH